MASFNLITVEYVVTYLCTVFKFILLNAGMMLILNDKIYLLVLSCINILFYKLPAYGFCLNTVAVN